MRKGISQRFFLVLVLCTFILISCTPNLEEPLDEIEEEPIAQKPIRGGTLSFSIHTPKNLNPLLEQQEGNFQLLKLLFQPLLGLGKNNKVMGVLAESWDIEDNGKRYVLKLQKDVLWHDGEEFTAEDVKFTIGALKDKDVSSPYREYVDMIKSSKVLDDQIVEITFHNSYKGNIEALCFPILPEHRFKDVKAVMTANKWKPIGTGPYKLKSLQKDKELKLEIHEEYWGNLPYIEEFRVKFRNKDTQIINAFASKDVDLLIPVNNDWNRFDEDEHLSIYPYTTHNYHFMGLNHQHELFKDTKVREAIQLAINREEMIRELLLNSGTIVDIPLSPESWLYDHGHTTVGYQPNQAELLLKEAGWKQSKKGVLYKELDDKKIEFSFDLIINNSNKMREKEANMIKSYLAAIGIETNIKKKNSKEIAEHIEEKDFDATLTGWGLSYMPDMSFAFHSNEIKDGKNFVSYRNKEVNDLLIRASKYQNETERKEVYTQLQHKLYQEFPYISLYIENTGLIINNRIKGPIEPTDFNIFNNIEEWYIEYE